MKKKKKTTKDFVSQMNTDDVREHSLMTSHIVKPMRKAWSTGAWERGPGVKNLNLLLNKLF